MDGKRWRLGVEMTFVLSTAFILKEWFFPFIIWSWFQTTDLASTLLEWTAIMSGIVSWFIYLGLGSSAKYGYGLRFRDSFFVFLTLHLPLWMGFISYGDQPIPILHLFSNGWYSLTTEWLHLFLSSSLIDHPAIPWLLSFSLFALGHLIQITEKRMLNRSEEKRKVVGRNE